MWDKKSLPALFKQKKDADDYRLVNVTSQQNSILEELEKAHLPHEGVDEGRGQREDDPAVPDHPAHHQVAQGRQRHASQLEPWQGARSAGYRIRAAALQYHIPYVTTLVALRTTIASIRYLRAGALPVQTLTQ